MALGMHVTYVPWTLITMKMAILFVVKWINVPL